MHPRRTPLGATHCGDVPNWQVGAHHDGFPQTRLCPNNTDLLGNPGFCPKIDRQWFWAHARLPTD